MSKDYCVSIGNSFIAKITSPSEDIMWEIFYLDPTNGKYFRDKFPSYEKCMNLIYAKIPAENHHLIEVKEEE